MDRGVWWATVCGVTELDTPDATVYIGNVSPLYKYTVLSPTFLKISV